MSRTKKDLSIAEIIEKRRNRLADKKSWRSLILRIAVLAIAGYLLLTQVFLITQTSGQGMFPSLKDGDLVIGFRLQLDQLAKKDIVVYTVDGKQYIGRIVARYTDMVNITEGGRLMVNGTTQSEEIVYPTYPGELLEYPYRVPEKSVFVLGDYRTRTKDSRDFEAIPLDAIDAKVITILRRRGL